MLPVLPEFTQHCIDVWESTHFEVAVTTGGGRGLVIVDDGRGLAGMAAGEAGGCGLGVGDEVLMSDMCGKPFLRSGLFSY